MRTMPMTEFRRTVLAPLLKGMNLPFLHPDEDFGADAREPDQSVGVGMKVGRCSMSLLVQFDRVKGTESSKAPMFTFHAEVNSSSSHWNAAEAAVLAQMFTAAAQAAAAVDVLAAEYKLVFDV